jgi:hypothetical protein
MQLKSNALPSLIWRLKPAINPATRFFLIALFIVGFTSSYFGDLPSKTHPQYAANADVFSCTRAGTMYFRNVWNAPGSKLGNATRGKTRFGSVKLLRSKGPVLDEIVAQR